MNGMFRKLVLLAATITSVAMLAGCSGSDGSNGLNGTNGTNGTNGANGADAPVTAIESCTVCHGSGSSYDVATVHASSSTGAIAISSVVALPIGNDLVVTFNAKVNGVNKSNYDTLNVDYRLDGSNMQRRDLSTDGTTATLTNNTNGNYTITIAGAIPAYGAINSRYLFRLQNAAEAALASAARPTGYRGIVMFDYPAAPVTDLLGSTSTSCADCHGSLGNGFHYGYPSNGGKNCVVCHDAANTNYPRLPAMVHGIHNSANMPTGKFILSTVDGADTWEYAIKFPSYMSNCSICHQTGAPLTAANAKAVTYDFCMTCHQNWSGFGDTTFGNLNHTNFTTATNCAACHDGSIAPATAVAIHNGANSNAGIVTERAGLIYDGTDVSVTEGAKINPQITGVTRTGNNLAITWTASYNGTPVNPCNATPAATVPAFAYSGQNFSILKAFFQGGDLVNANNGNASPGQPNSTNLSFTAITGNTSCSSNVATTTITLTAAEAALTGNGRVALQGKPQIMGPKSAAIQVRAKSPIYDFALATGAAVPARRTITDSALCLKCHVGSLYQHGGNRVDNVELCVMCHNEASSEQNVRVNMGVTATEAYDGKVGQTYGFKTMLHAVHSSGDATHKPLVIYRTRGVYAFGPDVTKIPNWPGSSVLETDLFTVYGSNPGAAQLPHFFATAHYPRALNDCSACHPSGFSSIPDQGIAVATTVNAGAAPWDNQLDDTLQGAASAACTSCHQSILVKPHADANGWIPWVFAAGRQFIIDLVK